jgi:hypothetical protein
VAIRAAYGDVIDEAGAVPVGITVTVAVGVTVGVTVTVAVAVSVPVAVDVAMAVAVAVPAVPVPGTGVPAVRPWAKSASPVCTVQVSLAAGLAALNPAQRSPCRLQ